MSEAQVRKIVEAAPVIPPEPARPNGADWPTPAPLPTTLPPVEDFDAALLPQGLRRWVMDVAERMQCPPDFPAAAAMVALGSVVGRQIGIRPKREDDWLVVPNLWGAIIGRPGVMKTPALQEPLRPLRALEMAAKEEHEIASQSWQARQIVAKEAAKVTGERIRKAMKNGENPDAIARQFVTENEDEPERRRYLVNDTTVEKLGEILKGNPRGALLFRDELTGFLRSLDREGHESARAFYLEAWNGDGRFTYDRIGRGTIDIEAACISVLGGVQPGPLAGYMASMARGGHGDDGLIQRFQMTVWPDISSDWENIDRLPDLQSRRAATDIFRRLDAIDADAIGASRAADAEIPFLHFSDEAQEIFNEWRAELEPRVRSDKEHPALEAHLSKYRSLVPSLALLCHLADNGIESVSAEAIARAADWAEYLETHARRLYSSAISPDVIAARALARRIMEEALTSPFALRDVYRHGWTGLATHDDATAAVNVLCELDWLRQERTPTDGRPRLVLHINPRWKDAAA